MNRKHEKLLKDINRDLEKRSIISRKTKNKLLEMQKQMMIDFLIYAIEQEQNPSKKEKLSQLYISFPMIMSKQMFIMSIWTALEDKKTVIFPDNLNKPKSFF